MKDGKVIQKLGSWAEADTMHNCNHSGPDGRAQERPKPLSGRAREIWRLVGSEKYGTLRKFESSPEWKEAEAKVKRLRNIEEKAQERKWVVLVSLLYPTKIPDSLIAGINPRKSAIRFRYLWRVRRTKRSFMAMNMS